MNNIFYKSMLKKFKYLSIYLAKTKSKKWEINVWIKFRELILLFK